MSEIAPGAQMPEWLRQRARLTPARLGLITAHEKLTFGELHRAVDDVAARLAAVGVRPGDHVALLAANSAGFVKVVHAIGRLGAVLVPLNVRLSRDEVAWQLRDSGARFLLHDEANAEAARNVDVPHVVRFDLSVLNALNLTPSVPLSVDPSLRLRAGSEGEGGEVDLNTVQGIVYTSGTTGRPKGAMLTYGNHFWSAMGSAINLGLLPDDRWLACLPLFHVGGLSILFRSVIYGIAAVVHESFDAERVNASIEHDRVRIVSVVATMLQRMLEARAGVPHPPHLRCVLLGGGPAPRALLEQCATLGVPVVLTYGLTETASQIVTLPPEDALRKLGSAGKPLFPAQVEIRREDGSVCSSREEGEIVVRGPMVTSGYLNRPDETDRVLAGGWLHTGDLGYLDAEGYLYVLDRRDDIIVSGGENVYPAEIEAVLQMHPAVFEAGVVGVDDQRWGRAPVAVVVLREGKQAGADELLDFCRERLARFKVPSRLSFAAALPRNAAGKLLRNELQASLERPTSPSVDVQRD